MLGVIKMYPTITAKQMSVTSRTVERDLAAIQKSGVLKREGKDNEGTWVIIGKIKDEIIEHTA